MKPSQESSVDRLLRARAEIDAALRRHKSTVTILFSDVVGSTTYFSRYGDTAGLAMLQRQGDLCAKVILEHEGAVIKTIGDSVMAEFPSALAGVHAAVEIQRQLQSLNETLAEHERIRLRIGIHTGAAFRRENDIFGDAVNFAARITKRTGPAQVLVSKAVQEAIASDADLQCVWLGKAQFEGRPENEDVYEVLWTEPTTYQELRKTATAALLRGDLVSPGLQLEELLSAAAAASSAASPSAAAQAPPERTIAQTPLTPLPQRFEVLGELGRGGMGIVYKAHDRETGEIVAIKLLMPQIASDEGMMNRFKREVRLARKITHKYVCRTHELYRTDESAFISMEFVEGESLRSALNRFGTLSLRKTIQLGRQICEGLQEAHAQGVVHRDLKPENVLLDAHGNVKLMDFGIARSTDISSNTSGQIVGTPAYMAPEQAEGKPVDGHADIYALGLILYEALTGIPAFVGETPVAVAIKQIQENPTPPRVLEKSIPPHVESVILRCLEKDPARRFESAEKLGEALCSTPAEEPRQTQSPPRARARLVAAGASIALLSGVFWLGRWTRVDRRAAHEANATANQPSQAPVSSAAGVSPSATKPAGEGAPATEARRSLSAGDSANATQVARNSQELEKLKRQNEQVRYYKFDLHESPVFAKIGPAQVRLGKASAKKQLYTLVFNTKEHVVDMKDHTLYEPIRFYDENTRLTLEVIAYKIEDGHIYGYLSEPGAAESRPPFPPSGASSKNP